MSELGDKLRSLAEAARERGTAAYANMARAYDHAAQLADAVEAVEADDGLDGIDEDVSMDQAAERAREARMRLRRAGRDTFATRVVPVRRGSGSMEPG